MANNQFSAEGLVQLERLRVARTQMLTSRNKSSGWGFFGTLALSLEIKEMTEKQYEAINKDGRQPTAMTDAKSFVFNPEWVAGLSVEQLVFLWAHEVSHIVLKHFWRRKPAILSMCAAFPKIDQKEVARVVDVAQDIVVNNMLTDCKMPMPPGGCTDNQYREMTFEQVAYDILSKMDNGKKDQSGGKGSMDNHQEPSKGNGEDGDGDGDGDSGAPQNAPSESEMRQDQQKWDNRVQAAALGQGIGNLPAQMQREFQSITDPELNWRVILQRFIMDAVKDDFRMLPSNRRYIAGGIYMPSCRNEKMNLVVMVDVSGSVDEEQLKTFIGELQGICDGLPQFDLHLIFQDAGEVKPENVHLLHKNDRLSDIPAPNGGGGTDFEPVWEYLSEQGVTPRVFIGITDMYANFGEEPEFPVLWASTGSDQAPFGELMMLKER